MESTSAPVTGCPVCGDGDTTTVYEGPVRAGVFGSFLSGRVVRCSSCAVDRLLIERPVTEETYRTGEYREMVGETREAAAFLDLHDSEQFEKVQFVAPHFQRGEVLADIGCGGGAFLDLLKGMAGQTIAVELTEPYHPALRARGHQVFSNAAACAQVWRGKVDLAVSFSVIEHVLDPVDFLRQIRSLLAASGRLVISTPNRDDALLRFGVPEYRSFFYRRVHPFYFDAQSLGRTCERAGLKVTEVRHFQRFGFTNFANWLSERRPTGRGLPPLTPGFDAIWKAELERNGVADYLYLVATPA
jgi:SAM-dependent methyltransferase